jgi:hypothetical protein
MRNALLLAGSLLLATPAWAQMPPPPAPGSPPGASQAPARPDRPPAPGDEDDHGMMRGRMGMMHARMMHRMMRPPSKAAHFAFRLGRGGFRVKCPDEEPVAACVDATLRLLDKVQSMRPPGPPR